MNNNEVNLKLNKEEALVLFEFLSRFTNEDKLTIEHTSEKRTLWNLLAILEKNLAVPLSKNYERLLEEARKSLKIDE